MSTIIPGDFMQAARTVASWSKPLLLSHAKPDGDALGSLVALRQLLKGRGLDPVAVLFEPLPSSYKLFETYDPLPVWGRDLKTEHLSDIDAVIVVDTCTYTQLEPIAAWLRGATVPKLAIDHHVNRDPLADTYLVDESAAAACLILYEWAVAAGWSLDQTARDALFVGMATDTGWFRFSNVDARVLLAAGNLASQGVRPHELHQALFQRDQPARIRLLGRALASLELHNDGRLALMTLTPQDYVETGAGAGDTENIVNEPLRIESVAVSCILVDRDEGFLRCSFRSKPPLSPGEPDVDVSLIASALGGGGHRRAAAARIAGSPDEVRRRVVDRLQEAVKTARTAAQP